MRRGTIAVLVTLAAASVACGWLSGSSKPVVASAGDFSPARPTIAQAALEFFNIRPTPEQPIEFPHKTHIAKGVMCTDCHEAVAKGPIAGIPGVKTCMICHESIATDRPLVQKVADYYKRKVDIPWQRVYGYPKGSHVRFQHAPHIRAGVNCANCHGNLAEQTVAQRSVDLTMGFCIGCHKSKQAPNDCLTCHF